MPDFVNTILIFALPVILAITLHEAAHGYAAKALGDPTAYLLGRVSLNPMRHIDPIGTIAMPIGILLLTQGQFLFGWAKPVPVQFGRLRHPKRDMIPVAFAGPAMNFVQAFIWGLFMLTLISLEFQESTAYKICQAGILANLIIFCFNLLPLPPLDGGRVLVGLAPSGLAIQISRIEPFGIWIVLALLLTGGLGTYWMLPAMELSGVLLQFLLEPFSWFLTGH
ncbi:MAG: site-2 protease family protein [Bordetella sp.]|jgi:Zn-dependent protease